MKRETTNSIAVLVVHGENYRSAQPMKEKEGRTKLFKTSTLARIAFDFEFYHFAPEAYFIDLENNTITR